MECCYQVTPDTVLHSRCLLDGVSSSCYHVAVDTNTRWVELTLARHCADPRGQSKSRCRSCRLTSTRTTPAPCPTAWMTTTWRAVPTAPAPAATALTASTCDTGDRGRYYGRCRCQHASRRRQRVLLKRGSILQALSYCQHVSRRRQQFRGGQGSTYGRSRYQHGRGRQ